MMAKVGAFNFAFSDYKKLNQGYVFRFGNIADMPIGYKFYYHPFSQFLGMVLTDFYMAQKEGVGTLNHEIINAIKESVGSELGFSVMDFTRKDKPGFVDYVMYDSEKSIKEGIEGEFDVSELSEGEGNLHELGDSFRIDNDNELQIYRNVKMTRDLAKDMDKITTDNLLYSLDNNRDLVIRRLDRSLRDNIKGMQVLSEDSLGHRSNVFGAYKHYADSALRQDISNMIINSKYFIGKRQDVADLSVETKMPLGFTGIHYYGMELLSKMYKGDRNIMRGGLSIHGDLGESHRLTDLFEMFIDRTNIRADRKGSKGQMFIDRTLLNMNKNLDKGKITLEHLGEIYRDVERGKLLLNRSLESNKGLEKGGYISHGDMAKLKARTHATVLERSVFSDKLTEFDTTLMRVGESLRTITSEAYVQRIGKSKRIDQAKLFVDLGLEQAKRDFIHTSQILRRKFAERNITSGLDLAKAVQGREIGKEWGLTIHRRGGGTRFSVVKAYKSGNAEAFREYEQGLDIARIYGEGHRVDEVEAYIEQTHVLSDRLKEHELYVPAKESAKKQPKVIKALIAKTPESMRAVDNELYLPKDTRRGVRSEKDLTIEDEVFEFFTNEKLLDLQNIMFFDKESKKLDIERVWDAIKSRERVTTLLDDWAYKLMKSGSEVGNQELLGHMMDEIIMATLLGSPGNIDDYIIYAEQDLKDSYVLDNNFLSGIKERIDSLVECGILAGDKSESDALLTFDVVDGLLKEKEGISVDEKVIGDVEERQSFLDTEKQTGEVMFRPSEFRIDNPLGFINAKEGDFAEDNVQASRVESEGHSVGNTNMATRWTVYGETLSDTFLGSKDKREGISTTEYFAGTRTESEGLLEDSMILQTLIVIPNYSYPMEVMEFADRVRWDGVVETGDILGEIPLRKGTVDSSFLANKNGKGGAEIQESTLGSKNLRNAVQDLQYSVADKYSNQAVIGMDYAYASKGKVIGVVMEENNQGIKDVKLSMVDEGSFVGSKGLKQGDSIGEFLLSHKNQKDSFLDYSYSVGNKNQKDSGVLVDIVSGKEKQTRATIEYTVGSKNQKPGVYTETVEAGKGLRLGWNAEVDFYGKPPKPVGTFEDTYLFGSKNQKDGLNPKNFLYSYKNQKDSVSHLIDVYGKRPKPGGAIDESYFYSHKNQKDSYVHSVDTSSKNQKPGHYMEFVASGKEKFGHMVDDYLAIIDKYGYCEEVLTGDKFKIGFVDNSRLEGVRIEGIGRIDGDFISGNVYKDGSSIEGIFADSEKFGLSHSSLTGFSEHYGLIGQDNLEGVKDKKPGNYESSVQGIKNVKDGMDFSFNFGSRNLKDSTLIESSLQGDYLDRVGSIDEGSVLGSNNPISGVYEFAPNLGEINKKDAVYGGAVMGSFNPLEGSYLNYTVGVKDVKDSVVLKGVLADNIPTQSHLNTDFIAINAPTESHLNTDFLADNIPTPGEMGEVIAYRKSAKDSIALIDVVAVNIPAPSHLQSDVVVAIKQLEKGVVFDHDVAEKNQKPGVYDFAPNFGEKNQKPGVYEFAPEFGEKNAKDSENLEDLIYAVKTKKPGWLKADGVVGSKKPMPSILEDSISYSHKEAQEANIQDSILGSSQERQADVLISLELGKEGNSELIETVLGQPQERGGYESDSILGGKGDRLGELSLDYVYGEYGGKPGILSSDYVYGEYYEKPGYLLVEESMAEKFDKPGFVYDDVFQAGKGKLDGDLNTSYVYGLKGNKPGLVDTEDDFTGGIKDSKDGDIDSNEVYSTKEGFSSWLNDSRSYADKTRKDAHLDSNDLVSTNIERVVDLITGYVFGHSEAVRSEYMQELITAIPEERRGRLLEAGLGQKEPMESKMIEVDLGKVMKEALLEEVDLAQGLLYDVDTDDDITDFLEYDFSTEGSSVVSGYGVPDYSDPHDPFNVYYPYSKDYTSHELLQLFPWDSKGDVESREGEGRVILKGNDSMSTAKVVDNDFRYSFEFKVEGNDSDCVRLIFDHHSDDYYYELKINGGDKHKRTGMYSHMALYRVWDGVRTKIGDPMQPKPWKRGQWHYVSMSLVDNRLVIKLDDFLQYDIENLNSI